MVLPFTATEPQALTTLGITVTQVPDGKGRGFDSLPGHKSSTHYDTAEYIMRRNPARNVTVYVGRPVHQRTLTTFTGSIKRGAWDMAKYDEAHPKPTTTVKFGFQR